jgi:2-C-methyl-D-erythritol 2,4-cyclodiphosphate synthase/2-C-methyl-D-erythritol 4-phosphate cytidylyltransferase
MAELQRKYPIELTKGGATRTETVYNALKAVTGEIVLIHDGARPFVSSREILECIACVRAHESGICAVPVVNTQARCVGGEIISVPNRAECYDVLTPQGFFTKTITCAYSQAMESGKAYTDDGSVYAEFCGKPHIFEGNRQNRKLTHPEDFYPAPSRVGFGVDTHAFGKAQDYITLCGVRVPSESGLIAHSDGDVAVHALMDALLGALALGDIGQHFPPSDETYRGADSMKLLSAVVSLMKEKGYRIGNVDLTVIAEKPKMAPHIPMMRQNIAAALETEIENVSVKATTTEKLGFTGRGEGIAAEAVVLLT